LEFSAHHHHDAEVSFPAKGIVEGSRKRDDMGQDNEDVDRDERWREKKGCREGREGSRNFAACSPTTYEKTVFTR
jgi:hypothetical protein